MEKHLKVNTAILDMVSTKPENIEAYDKIKINCAMCLTSANTRRLLSQGNIGVNTSQVIDIGEDENVKVMAINGLKIITAKVTAPEEPTVLVVNGGLVIEDSDKKKLDQYKGVYVNGAVILPKSFDTSNFLVNGAFITYPDGAILIYQGLELTNAFIKSAIPGATYFVQGIPENLNGITGQISSGAGKVLKEIGLKLTEPIDFELLKSKNIRFETPWITAIEENAEQLMQVVSGNIGSTIIPAGHKLMKGGRLDMMAIRRFGKKIYVDGSLEISDEDADALEAAESLYVEGSVTVADCLADIFFKKCAKYGDLIVYKGEWVDITASEYTIDVELLEEMDKGATFNAAGSSIEISDDAGYELLSEKINEIILKNSTLIMNQKQQKALRRKIKNKDSNIIIRELEVAQEPVQEMEPAPQNFVETKVNCSYYKL